MIINKKTNNNIETCLFKSTNIISSEYNTISGDLILTFGTGQQYSYSKVSNSDYLRFMLSDSQGKEFNNTIKSYPTTKLQKIDVNLLVESLKPQELTEVETQLLILIKNFILETETRKTINITNLYSLNQSIQNYVLANKK